jgi:ubiquinone/menaquinone biosynthesis C-methylase UbiE
MSFFRSNPDSLKFIPHTEEGSVCVSQNEDDPLKAKSSELPSTLWPDLYIFSRLPGLSDIIDIGCGVGKLSNHFANTGHCVTGIDVNLTSLRTAQKTKDCLCANYVMGSAAHIPFPDSKFDIAVIQAVLSMVERPQTRRAILCEAARVLNRDGILYMAEFCQNWKLAHYRDLYMENESITGEMGLFAVRDRSGNELFKTKHFTRRELVEMLLSAGFEIDSLRIVPFETGTGTKIDGFQIIARKNSSVNT